MPEAAWKKNRFFIRTTTFALGITFIILELISLFFLLIQYDSGFQLWWDIYKYIHSLAIFGFLGGLIILTIRFHFNIIPRYSSAREKSILVPRYFKFNRESLSLLFPRYIDGVTNKDNELRVRWKKIRKERSLEWFRIIWLKVDGKGYLIPVGADKEDYDKIISMMN